MCSTPSIDTWNNKPYVYDIIEDTLQQYFEGIHQAIPTKPKLAQQEMSVVIFLKAYWVVLLILKEMSILVFEIFQNLRIADFGF